VTIKQATGEKRNAYRILVGKPDGKRPLGRPSPPPVPILSQIDPIPTIPSYLSKIHFNIVHPSTSMLQYNIKMELRETGWYGLD
jgi:hypothetical protein